MPRRAARLVSAEAASKAPKPAASGSLLDDAAFLAALVESSDDAIIGKTLEGIVVSWNPAAERLYGYSAEEALGRPITLIVPAELEDEIAVILRQIDSGEKVDHYETVRERKDGTRIEVSLTISPIRDQAGRIVGASTIARDVSERRRAERAAELERSNAELEAFAYVASHDLQEPLRMVTSYVQLLARRYQGRLDADADEFIGYAVDGAKRMQELINDLLTYARVGGRARHEPVDLGACLERTLSRLGGALDESGATLTRDALPVVLGDESEFTQLFQNLIANALKFRAPAAPVIHVGAQAGEGEWVLSVSDNGIGIAAEYQERIFGIFKRLHTREEYPGTGIGLTICKKIVERLGGRIWVTSEPERGSTFRFALPAEQRQTAAAVEGAEI
jgi:PAS domain S-box-containing protein